MPLSAYELLGHNRANGIQVGGNPKGDAYGFRYWQKPGAFAEYRSTGSEGKFEGFLACLWSASFSKLTSPHV
jgi:amino acid transporter